MELDYTSKSVGNAALATGIIGTGLGAMNVLGNLGNFWNTNQQRNGRSGGTTDGHDELITRHEMNTVLAYEKQLQDKNMEINTLNSEKISDQKDIEVYKQLRAEMGAMRDKIWLDIDGIHNSLNNQAVQNQANKDSFQILQERMDTKSAELGGAIEREVATRKANDNLIVTYANATFTPKTVVTTSYAGGTITPSSSQQGTYNPLPCCDCND